MLIPARKVLWLRLFVFLPHSAMAAMDGPNAYLKGINIISYTLIVEKTVGGRGCNIDQDKLDTSLQFVANQSTKLEIVEFEQRLQRSSELDAKSNKPSLSSVEKEAAKKVAHDYLLMPTFFIHIMPLQTQVSCAGEISGRLNAYIEEQPHIIPTPVVWYGPTIQIWEAGYGFVGPQQTFSDQTIDTAEQIMKKLVNDWAASQ